MQKVNLHHNHHPDYLCPSVPNDFLPPIWELYKRTLFGLRREIDERPRVIPKGLATRREAVFFRTA